MPYKQRPTRTRKDAVQDAYKRTQAKRKAEAQRKARIEAKKKADAKKQRELAARRSAAGKKLSPAEKTKRTQAAQAASKKRGQQGPVLPKKLTKEQEAYKKMRLAEAKKKEKAAKQKGLDKKTKPRKVTRLNAIATKPDGTPKPKSKPSKPSTPVKSKSKPTVTSSGVSAQSKAYSKDARNREYDRLRKAGKTKEAEALGKLIAKEMVAKAPKNPFRAPQGAERKDTLYAQVKELKGMSAFNKGKAVSPERGPTFSENKQVANKPKSKPPAKAKTPAKKTVATKKPKAPKTTMSADARNKERRKSNIA